jgi:hypothetical protein
MKLPNIMDMFRGGTPAGNPNDPNINKPGDTHVSDRTDVNGVVPPQPNTDPTKDQNKNPADQTPMAEFKDLWNDDPNKEKSDPSKSVMDFTVDPQKMMEAAAKVDFASAIPPEILQKIQAGGEEGVRASIAAMNVIAQRTYGQGAMATTAIVQEAVKAARAEMAAQIPALIRAQTLSNNLADDNPLFANPAVVPILDGLKDRFLVKYPDATPAQLTDMAKNYLSKFADSLAPKPAKTSGNKSKTAGLPEDDWESFLTS